MGSFLYAFCNTGSERLLKAELLSLGWRLAFSRPGFVTFKSDLSFDLAQPKTDLKFAREWGESLGRVTQDPNQHTPADAVEVEPGQWWRLRPVAKRPWPAGRAETGIELPSKAPSRAYLKIQEAITIAKDRHIFELKKGDQALEFGSAPGGAVYALLQHGLKVAGVDPGAMSETLATNSNFTWLKKQSAQLTQGDLTRAFGDAPRIYVFSDMNVDAIEAIAALKRTVDLGAQVLGGALTLKSTGNLSEVERIKHLDLAREKLESLGFEVPFLSQLFFNREEVCALYRSRKSLK